MSQQAQRGNGQAFAPDYIDVATRLVEFRDKHPSGSLQPANPAEPYKVEMIVDQAFIVVVAAAYRTPDDPRPGIGMAYEAFPGRTPYTRGSELQNAETSAWGRAIVAALAADTKRGIASAEEVRNRQAEREEDSRPIGQGNGPDPMDRHRARSAARKLVAGAGPAAARTPPVPPVALKTAVQAAAEADVAILRGVRKWAVEKGMVSVDVRPAVAEAAAAFKLPDGPVTLVAWLDECISRVEAEGLTVNDQVRVIAEEGVPA